MSALPLPEVDPTERGHPRVQLFGLLAGPAAFFFLLLWPIEGLDPVARRAAAVTALTAVFWITVALPVGATSLLPAVLYPLLGVLPARECAPAYMHDLVILFLGAFVVALGLERWNVHRRMALILLSRVGTRPRRIVLGFMAVTAFLSLFLNNTATTLMMLPIGLAVVQSLDPETLDEGRTSPFCISLLLGIAYASSIGGMGSVVGTAPNQVYIGQLVQGFPDAPQPSFSEWLIAWLPLVVVFVLIAWFVLTRVVVRVRAEAAAGDDVVRAARAALGAPSRGEWMMAIVFGVTALLWITRSDLDLGFLRVPGWSRILLGARAADPVWYAAHQNDVSDATVALAMALLCFLLPVDRAKGVYLMDWRTATRMPWEVLLLIGGGFCLASGIRESGLDAVLGSQVARLVDPGSPLWTAAGVAFLTNMLSEVTSNTAITNVLMPVLAAAGPELSIDPRLLMAPAAIAASASFLLPVGTPPNALAFGTRRVPIGTMARAGVVLNVLVALAIAVVFQYWVRGVWGIEAGAPAWALP